MKWSLKCQIYLYTGMFPSVILGHMTSSIRTHVVIFVNLVADNEWKNTLLTEMHRLM